MRPFPASLKLALAGVLSCAQAHAAPVMPATPEQWRAAAEADIEAAVRVTLANHPGAVDPRNPAFKDNLEQARKAALALAAQVRDGAGYVAAAQGFNVRIRDGHAGMAVRLDQSAVPSPRWPGFVTVWRGDGLYVFGAAAGKPPVGSKLVACDGKPAEQLIRDNVFAFQGRVDEGGQWWSAARRVFVDDHNPFVRLPQRCTFASGGKQADYAIAWQPYDDQAEQWFKVSNFGDPRAVGMTEPRKNLFWVAMPTFQPNEAERKAYRDINAEVEANRARYLAADAIVIDLRGNQGGSSAWSVDFAKALWGKERVARARAARSAKTEVWWRASKDNTDYLDTLVARLKQQGQDEGAAWAGRNAAGMRKAYEAGEPFFIECGDAAHVAADPLADQSGDPVRFTRPVYVIVPGYCASACLDAIDVFSIFPNTKLMGAPSSADSTYMEVRIAPLPGERAAVIVPNKVYVNRARGNGEFYKPALPFTDVAWSEEGLLKAVEADLAKR